MQTSAAVRLPAVRSAGRATHWSAGYIGRAYVPQVFDCAHLVELVQREQFGREVELPKDRPSDRAREISQQIGLHIAQFVERRASGRDAADGDVVLMVGAGYLDHVGVWCGIAGEAWVLHNFIRARQVQLHRLRELGRWGLVVEGVYRWK